MKKVIFLDIDGVLRPFQYTKACEQLWNQNNECKTRDEFGYYFAPYAVDALQHILAMTDACIVISSDWRKNGFSEIKALWLQRRLPGYAKLIGITPFIGNNRGEEISAWLNANPKTKHYVIIDDYDDMGPRHAENFVRTTNKYGLTMDLANKCIETIKKEIDTF